MTKIGFLNKMTGQCGEDAACEYLKKKKYKILERNYKNVFGEIDIIVANKNTLVFVEVKTRSSQKFGTPAQAVNYTKKQKIVKTAMGYLSEMPTDLDIRFDVIEVFGKATTDKFYLEELNHIEAAFLEV